MGGGFLEQIKVRLMEELQTPVAFTIPLFGGIPVTLSVVVSWLVMGALILAAALLTGLGWFDKLAKRAGAGTLVPITGFANSMVSPALEFKSEGFVTGLGAKLFSIAGPVLVFGVSASVLYGLVLSGLSLLTGGVR